MRVLRLKTSIRSSLAGRFGAGERGSSRGEDGGRRRGAAGGLDGDLDGNNAGSVDLNGDGALQKGEGEQEAIILFHFNEDAFEPGEGAVLDANALAGFDVLPGFGGDAGFEDAVDGLNLAIFDRDGLSAETDDSHYARGGHDGKPAFRRDKAAKDIAREERQFDFGDALGPLAPRPVDGQELGKAFVPENGGDGSLVAAPHVESVPTVAGLATGWGIGHGGLRIGPVRAGCRYIRLHRRILLRKKWGGATTPNFRPRWLGLPTVQRRR